MTTTIVMPISRPDYLKRIFAQLDLMPCDQENINLFAYVDGDHGLYELARNLTVQSKFKERLCVFRAKGQANVSSVKRRRQRIADIHNEMKENLNASDYILSLEDDTLPPLTMMTRLHELHAMYPDAGFVSGVEIGRWGFEMIGAWNADDVYTTNKLTTVERGSGVEAVDAAGLYCCLTRTKLYMEHKFAPFDSILGPDVNFGLWLRQQGYKNYIDHQIKCNHLTKRGVIEYGRANIVQVKVERVGDTWIQGAI